MKKILTFLFTLLLVFGVAACGGNNNNSNNNDQETDASHEHTYAEEWSKNATHHWHAATCGHTSEVSDKAEHTWDEGVVTIEPTATEKGEKKFTCTVCAVTKNVTIDELGQEEPEHEHTFSDEWSSDETYHWHAATCEHTTEVSDKDEHDWDEGKVTTEPTVDTEGVKTFTCTVCEETKTESVAKLEIVTDTNITSKLQYVDIEIDETYNISSLLT